MGIVGLVAGVAGRAAGVFGGGHLRKALRFGGVLLMAAAAEVGYIGKFGNLRRRIAGMLRQGSVAGFASHVGVFAGRAGFGFVVVTNYTGVLPGEGYRALPDLCQGPRRVVPVPSKIFGDDGAANDEEESHTNDQDDGRHQQMSGIAEQAWQRFSPFPGWALCRIRLDWCCFRQ